MNSCTWREDWEGNWSTHCGHVHVLIDGKPEDNGMVFCCYCGGLLEQISFDSDAEETE